jgi:hypothetical protein
MSKPIEPGCKARIVNNIFPGNNGKIVTVIKPVEDGKDCCTIRHGQRWEINIFVRSKFGPMINHQGEKQLQRVDEYDGNEKISWKAMKDIWQPQKHLTPH